MARRTSIIAVMILCGSTLCGYSEEPSSQAGMQRSALNADQIKEQKEQPENFISKLLSSQGKILFDTKQNSIFVMDYPENIKQIGEYLGSADAPPQQVMIEARVVEVTLEGEHALGVNWNLFTDKGGGLRMGEFTLVSDLANKAGGVAQAIPYKNTFYPPNQTTSGSENPFTLTIFDKNINVVLKALSNRLRTTVLSAPSITTVNNQLANIQVIQKIPWAEPVIGQAVQGTTPQITWTIHFEEVGIVLSVKPNISDDGNISMLLTPSVSEKTGEISLIVSNGSGGEINYTVPVIDTRVLTSKVVVGDGQTLILGGLIKNNSTKGETKVPFLGNIPGLGYFFKSKKETRLKSELLIFISPKIITPAEIKSTNAIQENADKETEGPKIILEKAGLVEEFKKTAPDKGKATPGILPKEGGSSGTSGAGAKPRKTSEDAALNAVPEETPAVEKEVPAINTPAASMEEKQKSVERLLNLFDK